MCEVEGESEAQLVRRSCHRSPLRNTVKQKEPGKRRKAHHAVEVIETDDQSRGLGEFLPESIAQVVCWVGGDDEDLPPTTCELHCEATRARGLADPSFPSHEDPLQSLGLQHVGKAGGQGLVQLVRHLEHAESSEKSWYKGRFAERRGRVF